MNKNEYYYSLTRYLFFLLVYGNNIFLTLLIKFFSFDFIISNLIFSKSFNFSTSVNVKSSWPTLYTRSSNTSNLNKILSSPVILCDWPIFIKANALSTNRLSLSIS